MEDNMEDYRCQALELNRLSARTLERRWLSIVQTLFKEIDRLGTLAPLR
jgi:hypothetical protein